MKIHNLISTLLFLSYFSLSLFSQDSITVQNLQKLEKDLQNQITLLSDSLTKVQIEINRIEKVEYLEKLENDTLFSLSVVCKSNGNLRSADNDISEIVRKISKGDTLKLVDYKDGYWLASIEKLIGYINEVCIEKTDKIERFKEELIQRINQDKSSIEGVCLIKGNIRKEGNILSEIITTIKKGKIVNLIDYNERYWFVNTGKHYGYINEVCIKSTNEIERFKEELILTNKKKKSKSNINSNISSSTNSKNANLEIKQKTKSNYYNSSISSYRKSSSSYKSSTTQCYGRTKKGSRCKNKTKSSSGRCHLH